MQFLKSFIFFLFLTSAAYCTDSTVTKCFTVDYGIPAWKKPDSIQTAVNENKVQNDLIKSFPNPANNNIEFLIKIENENILSASIEDLNGNLIKTFSKSEIPDSGCIFWNMKSGNGIKALKGVYFLKISGLNIHFSHKFILSD